MHESTRWLSVLEHQMAQCVIANLGNSSAGLWEN